MIQETSREAHEDLKEVLTQKREVLYVAIEQAGSYGATLFELVEKTGMPINTVSGQVTGLKKSNRITDCGKRMNPKTGCNGMVWVTLEHYSTVANSSAGKSFDDGDPSEF